MCVAGEKVEVFFSRQKTTKCALGGGVGGIHNEWLFNCCIIRCEGLVSVEDRCGGFLLREGRKSGDSVNPLFYLEEHILQV